MADRTETLTDGANKVIRKRQNPMKFDGVPYYLFVKYCPTQNWAKETVAELRKIGFLARIFKDKKILPGYARWRIYIRRK